MNRTEFFNCFETGAKKMMTMLAHDVAKMSAEAGIDIPELTKEQNEYVQRMIKRKSDLRTINEKGLYLFTVRPSDDVAPRELVKATEKFCKRVYMSLDKYLVRFEQKGETEGDWRGWHVHILVKGIYRKKKKYVKSDYIRDLYATFSQFMKIEKQYIDVKEYKNGKLPVLLNYLNGNKCDPKKLKAQKMDRIWREKLKPHIPLIVGWGNLTE